MLNTGKRKILFVVNPVSGGKEKHDWEAAVREYFRDRPDQIETYVLDGKNDLTSLRHYIQRISPDIVVAVGGDGTVKMVAGLLKETTISLGILPAGSANGMAKELGIPQQVHEALDVIASGESRKIDLISINDEHLCIHLSDLGLNALLVKYFEDSEQRGMWGYSKGFFRVMWNKPSMHLTIKTGEQELKRKAYMLVLANAQTYGTGAIINPKGELDDGRFEIVVVRRLNLLELFKMLVTHRPFHPNRIEILQTNSVEVQLRRKTYFQVDGEYLGKRSFLRARILPKALNIICPACD